MYAEKLSPNFRLREFLVTSTGRKLHPPPAAVENLRRLCIALLQPLRDQVGPITVTSGWRDEETNRMVGGVKGSRHIRGEAADIAPAGKRVTVADLWNALIEGLAYDHIAVDQAILYSTHIHVSYSEGRNRGELLRRTPDGRLLPTGTRDVIPVEVFDVLGNSPL